MSNNAQVKRAMYGFMDPALPSQRAVGAVNDCLDLPEADFVRMLAAMLMDGARVDHSEFKYGMYQLMRNPTAPTNHVRDECRLAYKLIYIILKKTGREYQLLYCKK